MYKLVISDDEGKTIIVPLVRDLITVGRQDGNTVRLTERNVSRHHARFVRDEKGYRIEDLDSYNGVTVNGVRIDKAAELSDGDRVGVGDYVLAFRAEASTGTSTRALSARAPAPSSGFGAPPPARLVMLSPPAPGAEFSITKPAVSIGRLEELDLCISHRSISREHARIMQKSGGGLEIEDLRSANGVRVNGSSVKKAMLSSGDVVELGQVRFRFVGAGESYVFDPSEEQPATATVGRSGPRGRTMAAVIGLCAVAGGVIALWQDGSRQAGAAMRKEAPQPKLAPSTEAMPVDTDRLTAALDACRAATEAGQFADALAAADQGLALPGSGEELAECKRTAEDAQRATAAYEQGAKALHENKLEDAYFLFAGIPDDHAFRHRPEVKVTITRVAEERLARAKKQVRSAPTQARELATSVLDMQGIEESMREEAERILASTERPAQAAATMAAPRPRAAPVPAGEDEDPAKLVRSCLARGDQRCVVRALEGRTQNAQELALLIETYRALGETKKALKHMETFVTRYATARQAPQYRQFIDKHEP